MTLKRIAISLFLGPTIVFSAQIKSVSEVQLSHRLKFYSQLTSFETNFTQIKTLKDLKMNLKSKGKLSVERPHRVNWVITEPAPVSVLMDQEKVVVKMGEGSDAQTQIFKMSDLSTQDGFSSLATITSWMKLDAQQLSKDYEVTEDTKDLYTFKPKNKTDSLFESLEMSLAKSGYLKSLKIFEKSGDSLEIQFSEPKVSSSKVAAKKLGTKKAK